ncbi:MAG: hypothetical protein VB056_08700 [Sphaerochaeta associata]|nr:hypothetical protein [Sphaerochaeta associata]MEA5028949.1 hypothetical protein [Sphaerochaeta associata]
MKMRNHILRMVSVFFLVLMLVGCGIATYINITSSVFAIDKNDTLTSITAKYSVSNYSEQLSMISTGGGPALMLGYIVTNRTEVPSFNSYFKSTYQRNNIGLPVSTQEIVTYSSDSLDYSLYQFSDSAETEFRAPGYYALADSPTNPDLQFKLEIGLDPIRPTNKVINFTNLVGSYSLQGLPELRRFNGESFNTTISSILSDLENYPDYAIVGSEGSLYLHIFAASSITRGNFSNIYWTNLAHLGYLQLN